MIGLHQQLRGAWGTVAPYWRAEERWAALVLLLVVIALNFGLVSINIPLNQ